MLTLRLRIIALVAIPIIALMGIAVSLAQASSAPGASAALDSVGQPVGALSVIAHPSVPPKNKASKSAAAGGFGLKDASADTQGVPNAPFREEEDYPSVDCAEWRIVPSVDPSDQTEFYDIEVRASNDAWAVGTYYSTTTTIRNILIEHWDGAQWSVATYPAVNGYLHDLYAISSNDIWAVGYSYQGAETLALHWNGTQWAIVVTPNGSALGNKLYAVSATSTNDVWAVGDYRHTNGSEQALTMHWDGSSWTLVTAPVDPQVYSHNLFGLKAIAANDVWAVGDRSDFTDSYTAVFHWDGTQWNVVPSPNIGIDNNNLRDVDAVSANEVWAVGAYIDGNYYKTMTLRWNGSQWQVVYSPSPTVSNILYGIKVVSPTEIWAVGDMSGGSIRRTLALRWDGSDWSATRPLNSSTEDNSLYATSAAAPGELWAVGEYRVDYELKTLVERYSLGVCSSPTPTRTPFPTSTGTITSTPTPSCDPGWHQGAGPSPDPYFNRLYDIQAISPSDVWAVGTEANKTFVLHYDGATWSTVPSPNVGTFTNVLKSISVLAPNNIWAVGSWSDGPTDQTLIVHWDGAQWSVVSSPNLGQYSNLLYGVKAISANDIWAVGEYAPEFYGHESLILHWDGTGWNVVPHPAGGRLFGVDATSANDVWAVGTQGYDFPTLTLHWDGTAWTRSASPDFSTLYDVYTIAPNDVWAVGFYGFYMLAIHWNGTQWDVATEPGSFEGVLYGVSGLGTNDVWAVGNNSRQSTILRWNGTAWSSFTTPSDETRRNLFAIDPVASNDVWAVGHSTFIFTQGQTLIYHYGDLCNTPMPTPTHATSTPTSTSPPTTTATPAATATACPVQFTDVGPTHTFYTNIRCLACRGIINGYTNPADCPDTGAPCFKPGNLVTRGQLSKIVANAAGFNEPATGQQFQDVAPGSTFFDFVWRLKSRGYIDGYPCGGVGEPCVGPDNLPYFRPNANITRGQISKIVSNAAGLTQTPSGQQYEDVKTDHTFYPFIWRLSILGIMNGYPCGGPGEPCGSGNMPYFRPGANATRGQASKIVANTFYPDCSTPAR